MAYYRPGSATSGVLRRGPDEHMKLRLVIFAILGLALGVYLVTHVGLRSVLSAAIAVGWGAFATCASAASGCSC
jgi:hypothetical protein